MSIDILTPEDNFAGGLLLPPELWDSICSLLPKPSLLSLRLACSTLNAITLPRIYRAIRLEGFGSSAERFVEIAKSHRLRNLVCELTIDTSVGPDFPYNCNDSYPFPTEFLDALIYMHCFSSLSAIHLRFNQYCGEDDRVGLVIEETYGFRYRVLDTVFHCIAGMWTVDKQMAIEEKVEDELHDYERTYPENEFTGSLSQVMPLNELTITNLADYYDPDLASSDAFKKVMSMPSLTNLKLFVTTEKNEGTDDSIAYYEEKYVFFEYLPDTWLNQSISDNLTVLSLYACDYWGWFPKMDFRGMKFPQLKVLALGHYVFSHEWQIDWISSIGRGDGGEGLRELYLDDCPILFQACQASPLDESDPGYPILDSVLDREEAKIHKYTIRWSHILPRWATSMRGLREFRIGHGHWTADEAPEDTFESHLVDLGEDDEGESVLQYRLSNNTHRSFDCPELIDRDYGDEDPSKICATGKYLRGTGINGRGGCKLQYIKYNIYAGPSPWYENFWSYRLDDEGFEPEEGTWATDIAALEALTATVKARAANREASI
ncbi:uncharacterized protein FTOL_01961 [Fusarium torulosum]|uniref:F-box domain-containing protein n=1 Tax=Fusarium torulosum TaxID=33205 RepID=A0AAE8M1L6_9HYPO|nr:uncharacterized protein FTOL_01961 [Fusarium torulosum]